MTNRPRGSLHGPQTFFILLIDGETAITDNLAPFLGRSDFAVTVAYNGEEALQKMAKQPPELVVLDVLMPRVDGREVLRRLRQGGNWTPIILLTQDFVDQRRLDPLTLELYAPRDAGETVIYDEDKPDISVRYCRQENELIVQVSPAPGQVQIVLYGLTAREARTGGTPLDLASRNGAQMVTLPGTEGLSAIFVL